MTNFVKNRKMPASNRSKSHFQLCCAVLMLLLPNIASATPNERPNYKGIILSTGNEIKLYGYANTSEIPRFRESTHRPSDIDSWITSIDYYYDPLAKPQNSESRRQLDNSSISEPPASALCVLWLDANSNSIYKLGMNQSAPDGKMVPANSSFHGEIYVSRQFRLKLGHGQQQDTAIAQNNVSAYDFIIDRASNKLFVSIGGPSGHQLSMISLMNIDQTERAFRLTNGPATHLQVDKHEQLMFYLDSSSYIVRLSLINGTSFNLRSDPDNLPKSLTLDTQTKRLYWITERGAIWSTRYDGTERRCIADLETRRTLFEPFSMRLVNDRIYFSDIHKKSLFVVDTAGSLQRDTSYCSSSQRPNSTLIVESPTIYGFHLVESINLGEQKAQLSEGAEEKENETAEGGRAETIIETLANQYPPGYPHQRLMNSLMRLNHRDETPEHKNYRLPIESPYLAVALASLIVAALIIVAYVYARRTSKDLEGLEPIVTQV